MGIVLTVHVPLCSGETMKQAFIPQRLLSGLVYHTEMAVSLPHHHRWDSSSLCQCVWLVKVDAQI